MRMQSICPVANETGLRYAAAYGNARNAPRPQPDAPPSPLGRTRCHGAADRRDPGRCEERARHPGRRARADRGAAQGPGEWLGQPLHGRIPHGQRRGARAAVDGRGVPARARYRNRRPADRRQDRRGRLARAFGQIIVDAGQFGHLGAGAGPRGDWGRAAIGGAPPAGRAQRRAVRAAGGRRGDAADGRNLRDGPHHRRSHRPHAPPRPQGLHRQLRHAGRRRAHVRGRRPLSRIVLRRDRGGGAFRRSGPFDFGQAFGAASALRSCASRSLPACIGRQPARSRAGGGGGKHRADRGCRRKRAARPQPRSDCASGGRSCAGQVGWPGHGGAGLFEARHRSVPLGRCFGGGDGAHDARAAGQGRLLGQRDQGDAGTGPARLSAVHAQGPHRRVVPGLCARTAGQPAYRARIRQPQRAHRRDDRRLGGGAGQAQRRLRIPAAARHG